VLKKAKELEEKGMTIIVLSDGKEVIGIVGLTDEIKSESIQVVQDLRNMGIRSFMLTGDSEKPAKFVADNLKLEGFYSSLLPEDKVKIINQLKNKFSSVVMVGDGINDAPALASSSVGIAMASAGSDIAIENADIAIMNDNLNSLPFLAMLSRKTTSTIRFNVTCAILTKLLFIILAILGYANLAIAIFADVGVTVFVVLNSLRLFK
jgi:Cd2+/Zn2+-exporting ATPase